MPRSPIGWALTVGVPLLAVAIAFALKPGDSSGTSVQSQAASICGDAQHALEQLPQSPESIAEGLEIEHRTLAIKKRELAELQGLAPRAGDAFRAGLTADKTLMAGLSSMMARPDFVELSLTLPGHPDLVPGWLKSWSVREQALVAEAQARFSEAGVPACADSFG
jgi:hypothetical protein